LHASPPDNACLTAFGGQNPQAVGGDIQQALRRRANTQRPLLSPMPRLNISCIPEQKQ
jgi:hypothetical protein